VTAARSDFDLVQTGRGPDLLLLHSLLTDRTVFDPIVPRLARARRVTALNLPGFGASTPAGPRIEDYADRVADLFAALPLAPGADVIGMSFGGFVATALAARHGARIRRPALAAIANPTLVVVGTLDVTTPPALARELAAGIRGAALVEIPACAHCPPIEKPAELLAALEPFLDAPVPR
jgi:pimeloyl-ACP methyl ester carboxylesterase